MKTFSKLMLVLLFFSLCSVSGLAQSGPDQNRLVKFNGQIGSGVGEWVEVKREAQNVLFTLTNTNYRRDIVTLKKRIKAATEDQVIPEKRIPGEPEKFDDINLVNVVEEQATKEEIVKGGGLYHVTQDEKSQTTTVGFWRYRVKGK